MRVPRVTLVLAFAVAATFAAAAEADSARLVNIAARVAVGGTAGTPIPGFVLSGNGTKPMLVRAVGPTLASFGVNGILTDPRLTTTTGSVPPMPRSSGWQPRRWGPSRFPQTPGMPRS